MKRESVRGLIETEKGLAVIFRRKKGVEYYVVPGGGLEEGETKEEGLKRELREELNIEVDIKNEVFKVETDDRIEYFFVCDYIKGDFTLNGEELDRMTEDNYYEPTFIEISRINDYQISQDVKDYYNNK